MRGKERERKRERERDRERETEKKREGQRERETERDGEKRELKKWHFTFCMSIRSAIFWSNISLSHNLDRVAKILAKLCPQKFKDSYT